MYVHNIDRLIKHGKILITALLIIEYFTRKTYCIFIKKNSFVRLKIK